METRQLRAPSETAGEPNRPASDAVATSHTGATTISESKNEDYSDSSEIAYSSEKGGENALLITGGEVNIKSPRISKSGNESSENSDFYGTNAAVLATGGTLTLDDASINTDGAHANALFAYDGGKIVVKNTSIKTTDNNSGGIMVAGGGGIEATDLTVETSGNSSAPIRSDRGGGNITVTGGTYTSSGMGSPAIYSTAWIAVKDAKLVSKSSEGVVIEGNNSVQLANVELEDTNTTLNGNSETYKNIFIYQSMSGDASEGTGSFYATNSRITTNNGDTFFVTNTTADIQLTGNTIVNNDSSSAFLRAQAGKWGNTGSNGGHVKLTLNGQVAEGDIILDNLSSLDLVLGNSSFYMGAINSTNAAKTVSVSIDETSQLILAGDTFIDALSNSDTTNQNIYSNGHKLYVNGSEVAVNGSEAPDKPETKTETKTEEKPTETTTEPAKDGEPVDYVPYIVAGASILVIIGAILAIAIHSKRKRSPIMTSDSSFPAVGVNPGNRPDFSQFDDGPAPQGTSVPTNPATPTPQQFSGPAVPPQPTPPSRPRPPLVGQM